MNIRFLTLAQQEVDDAVVWYNNQAEDTSQEFLDELDRAVRFNPLLSTRLHRNRTADSKVSVGTLPLRFNLWNLTTDDCRNCSVSPSS
jgi:hypothetical protein